LVLDNFSKEMAYCKYAGEFFRYNAAAFGLPKVPGIYQTINSVAVNILRDMGHNVYLYLDDRLFITRPKSEAHAQKLLSGEEVPEGPFLGMLIMTMLGTCINRAKSELIPKTRIEFLGYIIDTILCIVAIPQGKWELFCKEAIEIRDSKSVTPKALEKIRGKMAAFALVALNMRLYIRRITNALREGADKQHIKVDQEIKDEINAWVNGPYVATSRSWLKEGIVPLEITEIFTDASNYAAGITIENSDLDVSIAFEEGDELSGQPIHLKEAYAVLYTLRNYGKKFRNRKILFQNDNKAVTTTFEVGCQDPRLTRFIRQIQEEAFKHNISLVCDWCSTKDQKADGASRRIDIREAIFRRQAFNDLSTKLNLEFTLDAMAMPNNAKCKAFVSRQQMDLAWNSEFFSIRDFKEHVIWVFPPKACTVTAFHWLQQHAKKNVWALVLVEYESISSIWPEIVKKPEFKVITDLGKDPILFPCKRWAKKFQGYWKAPLMMTVSILVHTPVSRKRTCPV